MRHHVEQADDTNRQEPQQHHRAEQHADARGPERLDQEQPQQHNDRSGQYDRMQHIGDDIHSFEGAQHRDRRGDYAVPIEKRGAEQARRREQRCPAPDMRAEAGLYQREQGENAAFAVIIGPHDDRGIFEGDDEQQ